MQEKQVIDLGLVKKEKLVLMSDDEVEKLINESNFLVLAIEDDYVLLPIELEDKLIWIRR